MKKYLASYKVFEKFRNNIYALMRGTASVLFVMYRQIQWVCASEILQEVKDTGYAQFSAGFRLLTLYLYPAGSWFHKTLRNYVSPLVHFCAVEKCFVKSAAGQAWLPKLLRHAQILITLHFSKTKRSLSTCKGRDYSSSSSQIISCVFGLFLILT